MVTDRYFVEFEGKGETTVRQELELGIYGEPRAKFARHWLAEREREANESAMAEQIALARSAATSAREAADAAREQAASAREANDIAKTARLIAIAAAIAATIIPILIALLD